MRSTLQCFNCNKTETETPQLHVRYCYEELWICSHCLPVLIHAPQKLIGKIQNADRIPPAATHKH